MKLSLRWIFTHINADWQSLDVSDLVARFNTHVAEIEHVEHVSHDLSSYVLGRVVSCDDDVLVHISEYDQRITLKKRSDVQPGRVYMLKKQADGYAWTTLADFGLEKEGVLPALQADEAQCLGAWRDAWECDDVILDVDNKSITHRPDMWGHRGFAREIAALFSLPFKKKDSFLFEVSQEGASSPITITNEAEDACSGFVGLHVPACEQAPSDLEMVSRFVKIGYRPHSAVVDITNFVMADWGHPMHAYDSSCISGGVLTVRKAAAGETLTLLDDTSLTLHTEDLVVADAEKILGLAGVMGGKDDSMKETTSSVFLEAACFSAAHIRRTALRHKSRTEASQRFEKTLDPMMAREALKRFVAVAQEKGLSLSLPYKMQIVGDDVEPVTLTFTQSFLQQRLGVEMGSDVVCALLEKLSFQVATHHEKNETTYTVTVPTFRSSKDVKIAEDILEEIIRLYGFEKIPSRLPFIASRPANLRPKMLVRRLKEFLATSGFREQKNYAFFDETVLKKFSWPRASAALRLRNPVSENSVHLIDSLLPHLLKNVSDNSADYDRIRFFEHGRVWHGDTQHAERQALALVWYEKRAKLDFFDLKTTVEQLCKLAHVSAVWEKISQEALPSWGLAGRCARLVVDGVVLGVFGQCDPLLVQKCGGLPESTMFACHLDASLMIEAQEKSYKVTTDARYQGSSFDVSMMIPLHKTVAELEQAIALCDSHIVRVRLIDFFEKKEWNDQRSVAFRIWLRSQHRSLHKDEIEQARQAVLSCIEANEGVLRS